MCEREMNLKTRNYHSKASIKCQGMQEKNRSCIELYFLTIMLIRHQVERKEAFHFGSEVNCIHKCLQTWEFTS